MSLFGLAAFDSKVTTIGGDHCTSMMLLCQGRLAVVDRWLSVLVFVMAIRDSPSQLLTLLVMLHT